MRNETVFALLVIFHIMVIRNVMSDCQATKQQVLEGNYNGTTKEFVIWWGMNHLRVECVHKCYRNILCITLQLTATGKCTMYAANLDLLKTYRTGTEFGVITHQFKIRGGYGGECASDTECQFSNSECRQSACACILGYAFNPPKNACTNGCATYGFSFATFPGIAVYGMDLDNNRNIKSLTDCQMFCSTKTNCKSFDYLPSENGCFLKWGGGLDKSFTLKDSNVHVVRNCLD